MPSVLSASASNIPHQSAKDQEGPGKADAEKLMQAVRDEEKEKLEKEKQIAL